MVVTAALLGMVGFVWQLQDADGSALRAVALDQMKRCTRVPAARGDITDRHGEPLAVVVRRDRVAAVPALVRPDDVPVLAALTARPVSVVRRLLDRHRTSLDLTIATLPEGGRSTGPRSRTARGLRRPRGPPALSRRRLSGRRTGLDRRGHPVEMERWPDLPLGATVGRAGLEQVYDPILRGTDGRQCVYVTPAGTPMALGPYTPPRRGSTLRLTLDLGLQHKLSHELATVLQGVPGEPRGDLGGSVVLDPRNGQVWPWRACRRTTTASSAHRSTTGRSRGWPAARRVRCSST